MHIALSQPVGQDSLSQPVGQDSLSQPVGQDSLSQPVGQAVLSQPVVDVEPQRFVTAPPVVSSAHPLLLLLISLC